MSNREYTSKASFHNTESRDEDVVRFKDDVDRRRLPARTYTYKEEVSTTQRSPETFYRRSRSPHSQRAHLDDYQDLRFSREERFTPPLDSRRLEDYDRDLRGRDHFTRSDLEMNDRSRLSVRLSPSPVRYHSPRRQYSPDRRSQQYSPSRSSSQLRGLSPSKHRSPPRHYSPKRRLRSRSSSPGNVDREYLYSHRSELDRYDREETDMHYRRSRFERDSSKTRRDATPDCYEVPVENYSKSFSSKRERSLETYDHDLPHKISRSDSFERKKLDDKCYDRTAYSRERSFYDDDRYREKAALKMSDRYSKSNNGKDGYSKSKDAVNNEPVTPGGFNVADINNILQTVGLKDLSASSYMKKCEEKKAEVTTKRRFNSTIYEKEKPMEGSSNSLASTAKSSNLDSAPACDDVSVMAIVREELEKEKERYCALIKAGHVSAKDDKELTRLTMLQTVFDKCQVAGKKSAKVSKITDDIDDADDTNERKRSKFGDGGNHMCGTCKKNFNNLPEFLTHLHSSAHKKLMDVTDRPWAPNSSLSTNDTALPRFWQLALKGADSLMPVNGFYCTACAKFCGDRVSAEVHLLSDKHNENYLTSFKDSVLKDLDDDPLTASKRNLSATPQEAAVSSSKSNRKSEQFRNIEMKQESFLATMKDSAGFMKHDGIRSSSGVMRRYRNHRPSRSPPPRSRRNRSPLAYHRRRQLSPSISRHSSSRKRISPPRRRPQHTGGKWNVAPERSISPSRRRRNPHLSFSSSTSKDSHEQSRSRRRRSPAERRDAGKSDKDEQRRNDDSPSPIRVDVDNIVVIDEDKDDVTSEMEPLPPGTE